MAALRKVEAGDSYDGDAARDSRGTIVEGVLLQEFEEEAAELDETLGDGPDESRGTFTRRRRR